MSTVCVKKSQSCDLRFSDIFHERLRILHQFFAHLYVPIYARLQIFIQLPQILKKLRYAILSATIYFT